MIAGAAPIDCAQPFMPHRMVKTPKITTVGIIECMNPSIPIKALTTVVTMSPVAMKRLMLQ